MSPAPGLVPISFGPAHARRPACGSGERVSRCPTATTLGVGAGVRCVPRMSQNARIRSGPTALAYTISPVLEGSLPLRSALLIRRSVVRVHPGALPTVLELAEIAQR